MKSKMILSLVMAAAVTLGGATMATNAGFNATAQVNGNVFTMGTVRLQGPTGEGTAINMDSIFKATNMGVDQVATKTSTITITGNLPVVLSTDTIENTRYTIDGKNGPKYITNLRNNVVPTGDDVVSTWWRHYKMAIEVKVNRYADNSWQVVSSRENGAFDSIYDTIQGTVHTGSPNTTGLNELLGQLGQLHKGDVVTITTRTQLVQTAGDGNGNPVTLTQDQINAFQGKSFGADFTIVATQAE